MARGVSDSSMDSQKAPYSLFSGMKKDPKYTFLHAFFLIWLSCSFQNLSIWPKTHFFSPILHVFAPLNGVRTFSAWSWKTTLITWIFGQAWYPLDIRVAPRYSWYYRLQYMCFFFSKSCTRCLKIIGTHTFSMHKDNTIETIPLRHIIYTIESIVW